MLAKEKYYSRGGELVDVFGVRSRRSFEFITGPGGGLGARNGGPRPFRFNKHGWECMLVVSGLIIQRVASLGRDSQNERDGAGLRSRAAPSQQRLRRRFVAAALQPSTVVHRQRRYGDAARARSSQARILE